MLPVLVWFSEPKALLLCSVLSEVRLERTVEFWDVQPASFHHWLQTEENEWQKRSRQTCAAHLQNRHGRTWPHCRTQVTESFTPAAAHINNLVKTVELLHLRLDLKKKCFIVLLTSCCNSPFWPQGGAVWHLWGNRRRRKRPAQFGGV